MGVLVRNAKKKSYCGLTIPNGPRTPRSPRAVLRVPVRAALELWQRRRRARSRPPRIEVPVKLRLLAPLARTPQQGSPHDREQEEERDTADDAAGDGAGVVYRHTLRAEGFISQGSRQKMDNWTHRGRSGAMRG
jgi:hypothetical protein